MGIESATYISQLIATNPVIGDPKTEGDDQIRLIKAVLLATCPNLSGAMTRTHTQLNSYGLLTVSASSPSGGADGDIWFQT